VRALILHAQGLSTPNCGEPEPNLEAIVRIVEKLGCLQIDTLQMVRRSQYIVLWSRLGKYNPADLDRLIYDPAERRLFEYWKHAASIIPLNEYRYHMPTMRWYREGNHHWSTEWAGAKTTPEYIGGVLERVRAEGPLRAADFEHAGEKRGSWWDWKPAKHALEHLYDRGELMVANRVNFQRVYDLKERVLPAWVGQNEATPEARDRRRVEEAVRALGVCRPGQAADYAYLKKNQALPALRELVGDGILLPIRARLLNGEKAEMLVHRGNLHLLERVAAGELPPERTTFLSPFDSLFWARGRDEELWGFRNVLEAYKPEKDRTWGYFCLPVLHRGRLVGRFDPKLERRAGRLRLKNLYLEPGVEPEEKLISDLAVALRDFLAFHGAQDLLIEQSTPASFGERVLAAL